MIEALSTSSTSRHAKLTVAPPTFGQATVVFTAAERAFFRIQQTYHAVASANAKKKNSAYLVFAGTLGTKLPLFAQLLMTPPSERARLMEAITRYVVNKKSVAGLESLFATLLTSKAVYANSIIRDAALTAWKHVAGTKPATEGADLVIDIDGSTAMLTSMSGVYAALLTPGPIDIGDLGSVLGTSAADSLAQGGGAEIGGVPIGLPGTDANQGVADADRYAINVICSFVGGAAGTFASTHGAGPYGGVLTAGVVGATCIEVLSPDAKQGPAPAPPTNADEGGVTPGRGNATNAQEGNSAAGTENEQGPKPQHEDQGGPDDTVYGSDSFLVGSLAQLGITPMNSHSCALAGLPQYRPDGSFQPGCMGDYFESHPSAAQAFGISRAAKAASGGQNVVLTGEVDNGKASSSTGKTIAGKAGGVIIPGGGINIVTPPKPET